MVLDAKLLVAVFLSGRLVLHHLPGEVLRTEAGNTLLGQKRYPGLSSRRLQQHDLESNLEGDSQRWVLDIDYQCWQSSWLQRVRPGFLDFEN